MAVAARGWDIVKRVVAMPTSGGTVNSDEFSAPRGSQAIVVHLPALAGAATLKLQALDPLDSSTWRDVKIYDLSAGTLNAVTIPNGSNAVTLPTAAIGAGVFRWVASADQSGAPTTITIVFSRATG